MKLNLMLLLSAVVISALPVVAGIPILANFTFSFNITEEWIPVKKTKCDFQCQEVYAPVCGSDDVTYSNGCHLAIYNCDRPEDSRITVKYIGACGSQSAM
ncbi:serine protease inhibitor Kazal-type 1-like [Physella acuta]|uniref:serine protease inhibitor Kazal-type 1-like n=1 Tax=Physella acuta TaxID=109671 RepID=UPI0027DAF68D|nr:serine protease inhibitor Kazal-type 1-like [Physella acuta]